MYTYLFIITGKTFYESGNEGRINSENFPDNYGANQNYHWAIAVPEGKRIEIRFQDVDIECSSDCLKDFLKIHDGRSAKDAILGTYCGKSQPAVVTSSGQHLYLYFRSDGSKESRGFSLFWRAKDIVTTTTASTTIVETTTTVQEPEGICVVLIIILSEIMRNVFDKIVSVIYFISHISSRIT